MLEALPRARGLQSRPRRLLRCSRRLTSIGASGCSPIAAAAEQALVTVVATAYLLGVSTRRVERLAGRLGVTCLSRSQVSEMATPLRCPGRRVPRAPARRRPVHVRLGRRADGEGPRGRPGGQRARPRRDRGERRRAPGDPRPGCGLGRGRCGLAGVPARAGRPRPVRGAAGHLRCPPGLVARDRVGAARRGLAAVSHPLEPYKINTAVVPVLGALVPGTEASRAAAEEKRGPVTGVGR